MTGAIATCEQFPLVRTEYKDMLAVIERTERPLATMTAQHGKSHSQFQNWMLDCSGPIAGPTKLRNLRHLLAVIERTRDALEDASLSCASHRAKRDKLFERAGCNGDDPVLAVEARRHDVLAKRIERQAAGAVRKLAAYCEQAEQLAAVIRQEMGKADDEDLTEEEFERDEERFHVMKAFQQALIAARARGGMIDEGNLIYLHDIGINGRLAQQDVVAYLEAEGELATYHAAAHSVHDFHRLEHKFLENMADKYAGCATEYAQRKGLNRISTVALLKE